MDTLISEASILLIVLILALIFFVCGIIHLLVRYLLATPVYRRRQEFDGDDDSNVTALQGQLQQLFHLHDCGVDQLFIDALPVFFYKAAVGCVSDPFDCAVCLCEFEPDSKLRLLPDCSHAFHVDCIDTWLLAHSTCPLCRSSLLAVRESASESSASSSAHAEVGESEAEERVVQVKLGKFRSVDAGVTEELDQRRCFSMGSYEYVMSESSSLLRVAVRPYKKRDHLAKSECDCHSRRQELNGFCDCHSRRQELNGFVNVDGSKKKESFSVSKIWMRSARGKAAAENGESSRRTVSFRLPLGRELKPMSVEDEGERGGDVESVVSTESQIAQTPSFARRTLLWIVNR